jgi:hypothetical protein
MGWGGRAPTHLNAAAEVALKWPMLGTLSVLLSNRGGRIRTGDPLLPKQVRYRTAPRPEMCLGP